MNEIPEKMICPMFDGGKCKENGKPCYNTIHGPKHDREDTCDIPSACHACVPYVEQVKEPAKCPACGRDMEPDGDCEVTCNNEDCGMFYSYFTPAFLKRISIAPEPLKCPVCGGDTDVSTDSHRSWVFCKNWRECNLIGPTRKTKEEAINAFRRLSYKGE